MLLRGLLLFILFWVIARAFWSFVDGVVRGASASGSGPAGPRPQGPVPVKMQPCPVCGTFVVPGKSLSQTIGGRTLYFCSEKCRAAHAA